MKSDERSISENGRQSRRQGQSSWACRGVAIAPLLMTFLCAFEPAAGQSDVETEAESTATFVIHDNRKLPLIFSDDFEKGRGRWQTTDDDAWTVRLEKNRTKGNHVLGLQKRKSDYHPKFRSPHNIALIKDLNVRDFVLTFDVKSTLDTGNHRDCCVFFCHKNASQFYYAHLGAKPDRASGQIMIVNDADRTPISENKKNVPWDGKWHHVKVTFSSTTGQIKVFFDDMKTPQMIASDSSLKGGRLGLGSFDDRNDFDNVMVYGR